MSDFYGGSPAASTTSPRRRWWLAVLVVVVALLGVLGVLALAGGGKLPWASSPTTPSSTVANSAVDTAAIIPQGDAIKAAQDDAKTRASVGSTEAIGITGWAAIVAGPGGPTTQDTTGIPHGYPAGGPGAIKAAVNATVAYQFASQTPDGWRKYTSLTSDNSGRDFQSSTTDPTVGGIALATSTQDRLDSDMAAKAGVVVVAWQRYTKSGSAYVVTMDVLAWQMTYKDGDWFVGAEPTLVNRSEMGQLPAARAVLPPLAWYR